MLFKFILYEWSSFGTTIYYQKKHRRVTVVDVFANPTHRPMDGRQARVRFSFSSLGEVLFQYELIYANMKSWTSDTSGFQA